MARPRKAVQDPTFLAAALEGLELQKNRIELQIREVRTLLGRSAPAAATPVAAPEKPSRKRNLSVDARERIAEAQKKRWAEFRKKKKPAKAAKAPTE